MRGVPEGWVRVRMTDVVHINPTKIRPDYEDRTPVVFVPMARVAEELGGIDVTERRPFAAIKRGYTQFQPGDVLFAKITPCMENGKIAIVPEIHPPLGYGSTEFFVMRPRADSIGPWIAYCVSRSRIRTLARKNMQGAVGQLRVPRNWLEDVEIPFAPIPEQHRIVAKLDELFSELDAGVAALERAWAKLKRYRASVLKAAVEGKLTEEWRQENPPDETGEELLERILVERRKHWEEEQLAKFKAQGRKPPKNWQQKYKEPVEPNTSELPELPEGWCWATAEQLGEVVTGTTPSTSDPANYGNHLPFFKPTDLDAGYRTRDARQHLSEVGASRCRRLPPLTVLVTCIGATIGKTGLARVICATNQQINALVPTLRERMGPYLFWYFTSPGGQQESTGRSSATTLPILNKGRFSKIPVPIPPLTEQDVLVGRLDAVMSAHEGIADTVDISRQRIFAIRQSILRCAFDGRLVPQDPNDEPASLMLERIRIAHEVERPQKSRH